MHRYRFSTLSASCFVLIALTLIITTDLSAQDRQRSAPVLINAPKLILPSEVFDEELSGIVTIGARIDKTGKVVAAIHLSGPAWLCGAYPTRLIDDTIDTIVANVKSSSYSPGLTNGVPDEMEILLKFDLNELRPKPTGNHQLDLGAKLISGGVLNGKATELARPYYPPQARTDRISGSVNVSILIDERGKIVSAGAISGHPYLQMAARDASCRSKFKPTTLSGAPVKVKGILTYNFVAP